MSSTNGHPAGAWQTFITENAEKITEHTSSLGEDVSTWLRQNHIIFLQTGRLRLLIKTVSGQNRTLAVLPEGSVLYAPFLEELVSSLEATRLIVSSEKCQLSVLSEPSTQQIDTIRPLWNVTQQRLEEALGLFNGLSASPETASKPVAPSGLTPAPNPQVINEKILPAGQANAVGCIELVLQHFKRPPVQNPLAFNDIKTLDRLAQRLEHLDFTVQRGEQDWPHLLESEFPFILEDTQGKWKWITGRKGNALIARQNDATEERLMPPGGNRKFLFLSIRSAAEDKPTIGKNFGLGWYILQLGKKGLLSAQMIMASILVQLFALGMPIFYMVIFDRVFGRQNLSALDIMAIGMIMVIALDGIVKLLRSYVLSHQLEHIDKTTINIILKKIFNIRLSTSNQELTRNFSECYNDFIRMNQSMVGMLLVTSLDVVFSGVVVAVLVMMHAQLALVSLAAIVPIIITTLWSSGAIRKRAQKFAQDQRNCQLQLREVLDQAETLKSGNASKTMQWRLSQRLEKVLEKHFRARFDRVNGTQNNSFFITLGSLVTLYVGAQAVLQGEISYGVYMAVNMLSRTVLGNIQRLLQAVTQFQEATGTLEQFKSLFEEKEESQINRNHLRLEQVQGRITLNDIYFKYESGSPWVLNGIRLSIEPGEKIVLAGKSGSGKTTLIRLLQRLHEPSAGLMTLDGFNIADMDVDFLRQQVAVALQRPAIFTGTMRDNILLNNPGAGMNELVNAIATAQLEETLLSIQNGLDGQVAFMGSNLSGGQAARIALARVLLVNPSVLILDEALAALDPATNGLIFNRILESYKNRTCIFVTDYLPIHQQADRILVLHDGQIAESGSYQELIQAKGYYYHLFQESHSSNRLVGIK